ncbi:MAG: polyphosphate kinase 1 [Flavobacteriaceae bacterium]
MSTSKYAYINREISWLQFNERVLQESADKRVPIIDRIRFLGIFSNNLDEFFRVRYATVKRIVDSDLSGKETLGGMLATDLLALITKISIEAQSKSLKTLKDITEELKSHSIYLINETELSTDQSAFVTNYFLSKVNPELTTIDLNTVEDFPMLKESAAYLAVRLVKNLSKVKRSSKTQEVHYALIEIPSSLNRFVVLPEEDQKNYVVMLDDVIRHCLNRIFFMFDYDAIEAHMIKITRDAELDIDDDLDKSFLEKISTSVSNRKISDPVRFVYDKRIKLDTLTFLTEKIGIEDTDSVIPGGRYHNRKDYMNFPNFGRSALQYSKIEPLAVPNFEMEVSVFDQIRQRDYMLYTPYQNYAYVIRFLKEAALDPKVKEIKITIYRLAGNSQVAAALINAAKNGKAVTVQIELQARFDEESNINYANRFKEAGIRLVFGIRGLKVHSKICVVTRETENKAVEYFGFISTGNFNESTARIYTDHTLFTAHKGILLETHKVFDFLETTYRVRKYKHLIVSPHYTESTFTRLIQQEIVNAKAGKEAYIRIKMNSFTSYKMIDKLYKASQEGVKIDLIIRGINCLIPGVKGMSENIRAISIVDKFLEHTRMFIFANGGDPKVYISSADWMTRNIENRVEVGVPIYQENLKSELMEVFDIYWNDNQKARVFSAKQDNAYRKNKKAPLRAQFALYDYYKNKLEI